MKLRNRFSFPHPEVLGELWPTESNRLRFESAGRRSFPAAHLRVKRTGDRVWGVPSSRLATSSRPRKNHHRFPPCGEFRSNIFDWPEGGWAWSDGFPAIRLACSLGTSGFHEPLPFFDPPGSGEGRIRRPHKSKKRILHPREG